MKLTTTFAPALLALTASASIFGGNDQAVIKDNDVPGKNPLTYCKDPKDYLLSIENVDLGT